MSNTSEDPSERAAKLRAQAERYRALTESLFDQNIAAVAQDCARELESEAAAHELLKFWRATRAA